MESPAPASDALPTPSRELNEPKSVKTILGALGALLALIGAYLLGTAEPQLNAEIERSIEMPLAEFRQLPEDVWIVVETERQNDLLKRRIAFGSILGGGVLLVLIALITKRRLRTAVIASIIVVIAAAAAFAVFAKKKRDVDLGGALEPGPSELKLEKIIVWVAIGFTLLSLAWAMKIALAYRRRLQATSQR